MKSKATRPSCFRGRKMNTGALYTGELAFCPPPGHTSQHHRCPYCSLRGTKPRRLPSSACARQRAALAEAQEGLDIVMAQLKDAKARLAGVQKRLAELQKGFDDAVAKKQVGGFCNGRGNECHFRFLPASTLIFSIGDLVDRLTCINVRLEMPEPKRPRSRRKVGGKS